MPRAFDTAWADAVQDVEAELGERVRVMPMLEGGARRPITADPSRPQREIVGRYHSGSAISELEGSRQRSSMDGTTRMLGATQILRISSGQLGALGYPIRQSDRIVLLDRPGEPAFSVIDATPSDVGEAKLMLARAG